MGLCVDTGGVGIVWYCCRLVHLWCERGGVGLLLQGYGSSVDAKASDQGSLMRILVALIRDT